MIVKAVIFLSAWANLRIDSWDRTAGGMRSEAQGLNSKRFNALGYEMPAEWCPLLVFIISYFLSIPRAALQRGLKAPRLCLIA